MLLVDTSVAVAVVLVDHEAHVSTLDALAEEELGLAGHAWFETYSVLTRLPAPARREAGTVQRLLQHDFPASHFLAPEAQSALAGRLPALGITGGAVYDALVGAAAHDHGSVLVTRDRRALDTYRKLEIEVRLLDD